MKALHTSDWHLGRTLGRRSRDEEFDAVLAEITAIAESVQPDLIVHSGDLFDTYRPAHKDILRAMRCLESLARIAPTVVLGGNHDSPDLFNLLGYVCTLRPEAEQGRLHFVHSRGDTEPGTVLDFDSRDGHERIRLAALPYVHPNRYLHLFPGFGTTAGAYAAGLRELQEQLFTRLSDGYDPGRDVLLFTAHQYVAGAKPANSERMWEVREPYATAADALPQVAYCALGHIHKPQSVGIGRRLAGYAGSPLQMDFGESEETKSVTVIEASPGRRTLITPHTLHSGRRLAHFRGTLEELSAAAAQYTGVYLKVLVHTDEPIPRLGERVAELVPDAILVDVDEECAATRATVLTGADAADDSQLDVTAAFSAYLAYAGTRGQNADEVVAAFADLLNTPDTELPHSPAEHLLAQAIATSWTSTAHSGTERTP
ncbi:exonuclease SbcCD subunit D [Streptomyces sp. MB09-02B]|uniref:exonuclease SbcCD subunit D n=1 Tax=Streptomyces sp. MB09-02B TaxID=3028667 RepID=UPI0029B94512|nr:exonuclease SbcCD subunit D [Streptomyces sp. MB09-02B]MDX3643798.1 exonuclease SbcCD subunit D [Streptomyces sp. MB09-02B]